MLFGQPTRLDSIPFSGIREVMARAAELEKRGMDIIHLEIGRPDFDTPVNIKNAAKKALDESKVFYTSNYGIIELRRAIAEKLRKANGLEYAPEDEIIVTTGVSEAVFDTIFSLLREGDEILVPDPVWLNYALIPRMIDAKPVYYHLREENNYQIDIEEIRQKITSKTRMMILISPNNPTGSVLQADVLNALSKLMVENNIIVISDEIYERIIFDNEQHVSIAQFPGMKEQTVVVNGFSKAYSMTGWRLGYIASSKEIVSILIKTHQYNATSATSFCQWAAIEALENSEEDVKRMVKEYQRRRDYIANAINGIDGLKCIMPKGAFYLFVNMKELGMSSTDFVYTLLKYGVSVVPGTTFGESGEGYFRLSYAADYDSLIQAAGRIKECVAANKK